MKPLLGLRVLAMEQVAALPFATRHLVDLGAEVIRVQAVDKLGPLPDASLLRGKKMVGLDLSRPQGPEVFRRLAAQCDVVAHNFTPRVMHKYGIDYSSIAAINQQVTYCSLTGYGTTGEWANRPLFGPGAEAFSGHNRLIGEADSLTPGRPGGLTYADYVCGSYLLLSLLDCIRCRRAGTWTGPRHIDVSLYETAVAQMGIAIAQRSAGAPLPTRQGNRDHRFAFQQCLELAPDRWLAVSVLTEQLPVFLQRCGAAELSGVADAVRGRSALDLERHLQADGIAAAVVADVADIVVDEQLWHRRYFAWMSENEVPQFGPAWGGGDAERLQGPSAIGLHNREILARIAGYSEEDITSLEQAGVIGGSNASFAIQASKTPASDCERGVLSRIDKEFSQWRNIESKFTNESIVVQERNREKAPNLAQPRILEIPGNVASAWAARLLCDLGWQVARIEIQPDPLRREASRWGGGEGGAFAYLHRGKYRLQTADMQRFSADVILGSSFDAVGFGGSVVAHLTGFGLTGPRASAVATDFTLQAASGLMFNTGEHDQAPQQLPPQAAHLIAGTLAACAIEAALLEAHRCQSSLRLDLAVREAMLSLVHAPVQRYLATGEVMRREGKVKQALRMAPTQDGFIYCAPGAVATADMDGVATLLGDERLRDPRFSTAEGRMQHWQEYQALMHEGFAKGNAGDWFRKADALHMTFALVQTVDDLFNCPQLLARGLMTEVQHDGKRLRMPGFPVHIEGLQPVGLVTDRPWPEGQRGNKS